VGHLDRSIGTIESVFLTYGSGAVVIGLILLAIRGGNLGSWHIPPWYAYSAGLLGLVIVGCLGYATPRLGLAVILIGVWLMVRQ
jgi:transporter family-2 protein